MDTKVIQILALILILTSCKSKQTENITTDAKSEKIGYILASEIIEDFYRDERLNPDKPDFENYRVKEFTVDLNQNQKSDSIILYQLKGFENDPGDYHQIEIKLDNGEKWIKTNFEGWVRFDNNYRIPDLIKMQNQLNTDLLLLTDFGETKIIGLFSWMYASQPGLLTIIEFSTGEPRLMINKKFDLINIDSTKIDVENFDGQQEIELIDNKIEIKK